MNTWQKIKIKDLPFTIGDGNYSSKYPKATDFLKQGVPFISNKDIKQGVILDDSLRYISFEQHAQLQKGHLKEGDVIISTRANIGDVAWVRKNFENANINAQLVFLRTDEKLLHNRFIYYLFSSKTYKKITKSFSGGSAQSQLPIKDLIEIPLEFPDYDSQKKIASVLSSYDDLIENNRRRISALEKMAQLLYTEWFVKFKFPGYKKVKMVDSGGAFGQIPKGWDIAKVGDLLTTVSRKEKIPVSDYLLDGEFPIVDQGRDFIAGYTNSKNAIYNQDLIVFGDHSRCIKYINFPFACGADGTQLLMTNDSERMPDILLYYMTLNAGLQNYNYARHFKFLKSLKIINPSALVAKKFADLVCNTYLQIRTLRDHNKNLTDTRNLLIPRLFAEGVNSLS